jgi:hypothetical protein
MNKRCLEGVEFGKCNFEIPWSVNVVSWKSVIKIHIAIF